MMRLVLDQIGRNWRVHEDLRWLYYAGSPIDVVTFREAVDAFEGRMVQSYAQMESPMFFTVLDAADHRRAVAEGDSDLIESAGRLLPDVELRFTDPEGNEVEAGDPGEILARAPQTMSGYWQRPEATEQTLRDGWLHTGDVGVMRNGYLHVVDRVKDMIVSGGSNVFAREVEEVLAGLAGVAEAAVIGLPDRIWGEAVVAVLVPDREPLDDDVVKAHCRRHLADYKNPKRIAWVDALPRNANGKVLKRELRTALASSTTGAPS